MQRGPRGTSVRRGSTRIGGTLDEEQSAFRATQLLDFLLAAVGPQIYNQGVEDARGFVQRKLDDLDAEILELDEL